MNRDMLNVEPLAEYARDALDSEAANEIPRRLEGITSDFKRLAEDTRALAGDVMRVQRSAARAVSHYAVRHPAATLAAVAAVGAAVAVLIWYRVERAGNRTELNEADLA